MGQWDEFKVKNATLSLRILFSGFSLLGGGLGGWRGGPPACQKLLIPPHQGKFPQKTTPTTTKSSSPQ